MHCSIYLHPRTAPFVIWNSFVKSVDVLVSYVWNLFECVQVNKFKEQLYWSLSTKYENSESVDRTLCSLAGEFLFDIQYAYIQLHCKLA